MLKKYGSGSVSLRDLTHSTVSSKTTATSVSTALSNITNRLGEGWVREEWVGEFGGRDRMKERRSLEYI